MEYELRVIVEKVAVGSQEVVKRDTLKVYDLKKPESILDLGLRHIEQISLLEKVQDVLLAEQTILIDLEDKKCPRCEGKLKKNGYTESKFSAVFSDHELRVQKHRCNNPECNWQSCPTITSLFKTNIHPDLAKLQCEQGALFSYREAQRNLERINCQERTVNNHTQIKRLTGKVGEIISVHNSQTATIEDIHEKAEELIVQVDGGHIPIQEKGKRSFEAIAAVIYQPKNVQEIDKNHRQIIQKTCVVSAQADELKTIKAYLLNAALKQGLDGQTKVVALADGAKNCWSVILSLQSHCQSLECILDWFHIGKKFQNVKQSLGEAFTKSLDSAKWELWHGHLEQCLTKLTLTVENLTDESKKTQLTGLLDYLQRNQAYLVNYEGKKRANQTYTSQVAESHIDSLINARHNRTGKMQWTRQGAHQVLQIRAMMASNQWNNQWHNLVLSALGAVS